MAPAPNRCPADPEDVAEAYVIGNLPDAAAAAFEEHYIACNRCLGVVEATEDFVRAMRSAARELR